MRDFDPGYVSSGSKTGCYRIAISPSGFLQTADIAKSDVVLRSPLARMNTRDAGMAYTSSQASFAASAKWRLVLTLICSSFCRTCWCHVSVVMAFSASLLVRTAE